MPAPKSQLCLDRDHPRRAFQRMNVPGKIDGHQEGEYESRPQVATLLQLASDKLSSPVLSLFAGQCGWRRSCLATTVSDGQQGCVERLERRDTGCDEPAAGDKAYGAGWLSTWKACDALHALILSGLPDG